MDIIKELVDARLVRSIDASLVRMVLPCHASDAVRLTLLATSSGMGGGDVCLSLADALESPASLFGVDILPASIHDDLLIRVREIMGGSTVDSLKSELSSLSSVVSLSGFINPSKPTPFVLDDGDIPAIYLWRSYEHEASLRSAVRRLINSPPDRKLVEDALPLLEHYFPRTNTDKNGTIDWQRLACVSALANEFSVITGGPGTGKTTTVMRLIVILQSMRISSGLPPYRVSLMAPTGKAAARLGESIRAQKEGIKIHEYNQAKEDAIRAAIPSEVTTVHRALKPIPGTSRFRHNESNYLDSDLVVVDESSMLDLELSSHLFRAINPEAKVVMLGDKDQLASVEAGAVFTRLCQYADEISTSREMADTLTLGGGVEFPEHLVGASNPSPFQGLVKLRKSHRFDDNGGIGKLARLVNECTKATAITTRKEISALLMDSKSISITEKRASDAAEHIALTARDQYRAVLEIVLNPPQNKDESAIEAWAREALNKKNTFQVLTAVRKGDLGVTALNAGIESKVLKEAGFERWIEWYPGRPVMVTSNNYSAGLMNGDTGIVLRYVDTKGQSVLRVAFMQADGRVKMVLPSRINPCETSFAITTHKSQGSEFDSVLMVVPEHDSPVLTKELIYTGITRSKLSFNMVVANEALLMRAIARKTSRKSGALF